MAERKTPILSFKEVAAIETYMLREPAESNGFWLKLSKIGALETTISKDEAIEAALCCGWIDGQLAKFDEHHFLTSPTSAPMSTLPMEPLRCVSRSSRSRITT
jgi:uncharacterized protein YdeI (YjbR/CyaY-like superfamily)